MADYEHQNDGEVKTRWVRTSVDILEHPVLDRGPYDRRSAWQWMIFKAAWKAKRVNHKNVIITLERGQVLIGRSYLAKTWGWSEQQVRTFLNQLLAESMLEINQSNGHLANVATICNYEKYQAAQPERTRANNQSLTSAQPVPNQTLTSYTNNTIVSEGAREGEVANAHGVFVNCETIRHASFTISLPAIEMATVASGLPSDEIKKICTAHALQWAAEIEGGKLSQNVLPSKIANFLASTIMREKARSASAPTAGGGPRQALSSGAAWHEDRRTKAKTILALARGEPIAHG